MAPFDGRPLECWRQAAAGKDMFGRELSRVAVENDQFARFDIHGAHKQPDGALGQPIEIHVLCEQSARGRHVVEAGPVLRHLAEAERGHQTARGEKIRQAEHRDLAGCDRAPKVFVRDVRRNRRDIRPEPFERLDRMIRVARDHRAIEGADRHAGQVSPGDR